MINKETETLISIKDVPAFIEKKTGKRLSLPTIYRWIERGVNGVKLEITYSFNKSFTSVEALGRFDSATADAKLSKLANAIAKPATSLQLTRAHEAAKVRLRK